MSVWLSIRWVIVHFRTRFRMDYTDREKAELAPWLFFLIWRRAQHFVFIVSIQKNNTHLTESIDVWNSYGKSKSTEYLWVSFTLIKKKRAGIAGNTVDLRGLRSRVEAQDQQIGEIKTILEEKATSGPSHSEVQRKRSAPSPDWTPEQKKSRSEDLEKILQKNQMPAWGLVKDSRPSTAWWTSWK